MTYVAILIGGILINNYIFMKFLGLCPFLGLSKQVDTAVGMSFALTFVMAAASGVVWLFQRFILVPLHLEYLQTIAFILVIAALVQFVEMVVQKLSPTLYQALGIYLPLITTNCAVLGVALLNVQANYNLVESVVNGIAGALGWSMATILFAGIRERLAFSKIAKPLEGFPIALISSSLLSLSFFGFQGLFKFLFIK
jgi:electron transport complex protein RnfA